MIRVCLAAPFLAALPAYATTPAPWMIEHQRCLGKMADERMATVVEKLSRVEARALAEEIYWACGALMPIEMSAVDRVRFIHEQSRDFARRLRYQSGNAR